MLTVHYTAKTWHQSHLRRSLGNGGLAAVGLGLVEGLREAGGEVANVPR